MIRIDLEADSLRAALDAVTARAQDATPLMQDLAQVMAEQTRRRFQESRGPDGTPSAPNSMVTVGWRAGQSSPARVPPIRAPAGRLSESSVVAGTGRQGRSGARRTRPSRPVVGLA